MVLKIQNVFEARKAKKAAAAQQAAERKAAKAKSLPKGVVDLAEKPDPARKKVKPLSDYILDAAEQLDQGINIALFFGIVFLLVVAFAIFLHSVYAVIDHRHGLFLELATTVINGILLVFIVLELIETAQTQLERGFRKRIQGDLVRKLLIIGILSAVRHILTIGADLSRTPPGNNAKDAAQFTHSLQELGVDATVVLVLVLALVLVSRFYREQDLVADELTKLNDLRASGVIADQEFEDLKAKILGSSERPT
jgi:Short C-terminal domain/Phosphate-starvation-inducible E family